MRQFRINYDRLRAAEIVECIKIVAYCYFVVARK